MSRRKKLSREDRAKRAGKRAARAEAAPLREAVRSARGIMRGGQAFIENPLAQAAAVYEFACLAAQLDPPELIVCSRCGLVQENIVGFVVGETGLSVVPTCDGFEKIGCGEMFAETVESFERHVQHVTI